MDSTRRGLPSRVGVWRRFGTKWAIWSHAAEVARLSVAVVWLARFSGEIEGVIAEAVDVLGEVGTDSGDGVFRHGFFPLFQVLDKPGQ